MKRCNILLLFLFLTSCVSRVERDPRDLLLHLPSEPATLHLLTYSDHYAAQILANIYERLVDIDPKTLALTPGLATSWKVEEEGKKIFFTLRQNVSWHDGAPFTADDVIFTFEQIMNPKTDAPRLRQQYHDVEKLEKIDEMTVCFHLNRPTFRSLFTVGALPVLPKHLFLKDADINHHRIGEEPVGTGPYRFVSWDRGRNIRLIRNEMYWGEKPQIHGIVFKIIPNASVAFQMLKKGGVDLFELSPLQWTKQTSSSSFQERFTKHQYFSPNFSFITWNMRRSLFAQKEVRQAMTMLLNRESILERQLYGLGKIVTGSGYPFGNDYDAAALPLPYNPERAKALLQKAGWSDHDGDGLLDRDGIPFEFSYLFPNSSRFSKNVGLLLQNELMKVGIRMHLIQLEWATLLKKVQEHDFDAVSLSWVPPLQADPFQLWHSSQGAKGSNLSGLALPRVDRLLEEAQVIFDDEERGKRYRELHRMIDEEQPVTFLFTAPTLAAVASRFTNVHPYAIGFEPIEWGVEMHGVLKAW